MIMWCVADYALLLRCILTIIALSSPVSAAFGSSDTDNNCTLVTTRQNYATKLYFSTPIAVNMTDDTHYSLNNCSLVQPSPRTRPAPLGNNSLNDQLGWLGIAVFFFISNQSTLLSNVSIFVTGGTMLAHVQLSNVSDADQTSAAVATNDVTVQFNGVLQSVQVTPTTTTTIATLRAPLIIALGNTTQLQLRIVSCTLNIAFYDAFPSDCVTSRRAALIQAETSNHIIGVYAEIATSEVRIVSSAGCTLFATIANEDLGRLVNLSWSFLHSTVAVALPFVLPQTQGFVFHSAENISNIMTDVVNSSLFARDGGLFPFFKASFLPKRGAIERCGSGGRFAFVAFDSSVESTNTTTRIRSGSRLYASFLCFDPPNRKDFFGQFDAPVPSVMSDKTFITSSSMADCTVVSSDVYAVQYTAPNTAESIVHSATVVMEGNSSLLLAGTHHAVGVLVKSFAPGNLNLVDGFSMLVTDVSVVLTAYGPLSQGVQAARIGALLVVDRCSNVTGPFVITLSYVDAFIFTQSGMATDSAANNDTLSVASASVLYIASAIYNTGHVTCHRCALNGNVSGGIPPAYKNRAILGMVSSISLIYVIKLFPVVGCLFWVRDSFVHAATGYQALPTVFVTTPLFLGTVIQVSALQLNAAAMNSSTVIVDSTTVVVMQHNFSMLGVRQSFLGFFSSVNTTSIVSIGDTSQIGFMIAGSLISVMSESFRDVVKTKMVVKDTSIVIRNSSASYASGLVLGAMDTLLAVALPSIGINVSIDLQEAGLGAAVYSSSDARPFPSYPSALFAPAGAATFTNCVFSVRDPQQQPSGIPTDPASRASNSEVSTLRPAIGLLIFSGDVTLDNTTLSFAKISFFPSVVTQSYLINVTGDYNNAVFRAILQGSSQVIVNGSSFNGTRSLFQQDKTTWDTNVPKATEHKNRSVRIVGCNRWGTTDHGYQHMSFKDINAPRTLIDTSQATCFEHGTPTWTTTLPLAYVPPEKTVQEKLADASTGVIAGIGAAAALSAALLGPSGLMDAQALAAYGRSACAPPALKKASQGAQFLQAPFYALGDDIAVIANLVIVFLLSAAHFGAVQYLTRRRNRALSSSTTSLSAPPLKTVHNSSGQPTATPDLLSIEISSHSSSSHLVATTNEYLAPATFATGNKTQQFNATHMPRLKKHLTPDSVATSRSSPKGNISQQSVRESLRFVNIGTSLLFSGTVSGTICGVCVAIACGIGAYYLIRLCRWRYLLRYFAFEPYTPEEKYRLDDHMLSSTEGRRSNCASLLVANIPLSMLPMGRWTPQHLSAMYGPLRNSIRD
ncbi:membrane-associated protein, putative, partial [Bodo saltans]